MNKNYTVTLEDSEGNKTVFTFENETNSPPGKVIIDFTRMTINTIGQEAKIFEVIK